MKKHSEFVLLTILVILLRVADGVVTYRITPDLSRELNPLAFGGWTLLIGAAFIVVTASTILNYYQIYCPINNFPDEPGYDLKSFKKHYFNIRTNKLAATKPGKIFAYVFGYTLPRTLIVWSALLVINNILVYTENEVYESIRHRYKLWFFVYCSLPIIGLLFLERLQRTDFRRYRELV